MGTKYDHNLINTRVCFQCFVCIDILDFVLTFLLWLSIIYYSSYYVENLYEVFCI